VSILHPKLGPHEGHEARRMGLKAMPLDQHIEGRHGERELGVEILPPAVHDPVDWRGRLIGSALPVRLFLANLR
jgi:hypothetical protein